ncbi:MAG: glycosyltransferase family 2 protein [Acidobacteria bacterium]|nr:MAG: glycosyltransferase family 2 protein [Acidobacteriota bacterium]
MSKIRSVAVLILSWNGRKHLETCLPALVAQRDPGVAWRVMVLDNGSWDGTGEWVAQHHPAVELIRSDVNLGFCRGVNRLVARCDADAVALLNDDTRPREDWLAALVDALRAAPPDVAAASGKIVDWRGERLDFGRGLMTFDGHAFQLDYRRPLERARVPAAGAELPFACGGNMLIRRRSFQAAGGFDGDYFAYLEDVDLGWRLWAGGERVIFAPAAVVHHRSMASSDLLGYAHRGFLFERNAFLTAYKNYQPGLFENVMPAILWTLLHRTQTLLVQNNPGGDELTLDPYAGHIANTAAPEDAAAEPASAIDAAGRALAPAPAPPSIGLYGKWRAYGTRELLRRGLRKAVRAALPRFVLDPAPAAGVPLLTDGRTVAQLRAITYLLGHLDAAADKRHAVQARRRRPDGEIFARFPAAVVPTYPGDERLFASAAFAELLPAGLPVVRYRLDEVMELDS